MNNINYPVVIGLPAESDLRNNDIQSERFGLTSKVGLIRRKMSAVRSGKLGGRIKLALGIIYFFSLMYFTLVLIT